MGVAVVLAARRQAREPVGRRPLPHVGRRTTDRGTRYVRALLPHRLRRQGSDLCRHFYECDPLGQCRQVVCRTDGKVMDRGAANARRACRALTPWRAYALTLLTFVGTTVS